MDRSLESDIKEGKGGDQMKMSILRAGIILTLGLASAFGAEQTITCRITGGSSTEGAKQALDALFTLPVGWDHAPASVGAGLFLFCGWLVTAISVLFGAPFWFDLLQRLVNLRGTGRKPAAAAEKSG